MDLGVISETNSPEDEKEILVSAGLRKYSQSPCPLDMVGVQHKKSAVNQIRNNLMAVDSDRTISDIQSPKAYKNQHRINRNVVNQMELIGSREVPLRVQIFKNNDKNQKYENLEDKNNNSASSNHKNKHIEKSELLRESDYYQKSSNKKSVDQDQNFMDQSGLPPLMPDLTRRIISEKFDMK